MRFIVLITLPLLSACGAWTQLFQSVEDIANDDAITVMVSREAIGKQTDVSIDIQIINNPGQ